MPNVVPAKKVTIQGGKSLDVEAGKTYRVVTRSHEFGNKEWTEVLQSVQTLSPGTGHDFDFLHFEQHGARDFTIAEMTEVSVVGTIDITPTWSALLPVFIGVLQNDEAPVSAHKEAIANLTGMAALADKYVALVKAGSGDTVGLTPVLGDPDQKES